MVSSKHGLERKFKPWRKGKSSSKSKARIVNDDEEGDAASSGLSLRRSRDDGPKNIQKKNNNSRHTNASLKNLLRSQRRLLDRLIKSNNEVVVNKDNDDTANDSNDGDDTVATRSRIKLLEEEIAAHEAREREKKNASKYHQVKFIERQKLTRLAKSVKRQLQQAIKQQSTNTNNDKRQARQQKQISNLEIQLQSISMDQLYIAFYPTDIKYMALFTNGMNRVVDDERGRARRQKVWNTIREGLLEELKTTTTTTTTTDKNNEDDNNEHDSNDGGNDSGNDSSSVPSSDSESDVEDVKPVTQKQKKKPLLIQTKKWINLDDAKRVLLSMPVDTYPNSTSYSTDTAPAVTNTTNKFTSNGVAHGKDAPTSSNKMKVQQSAVVLTAITAAKTISDSRFALSSDLNKLFPESTIGDDYYTTTTKEEEMEVESINNSDESHSDSSSDEDDVDPLLDFNNTKAKSSVSKVAPPSLSSSSDDSSDDSLDSDSNAAPSSSSFPSKDMTSNNADVMNERHTDKCKEVDEKIDDDFFATATTTTTSTEDIFSQVQNQGSCSTSDGYNQKHRNTTATKGGGGGGGKGDKSRGFKTQKQSKKEYASFQNRNKRQKFI